MTTTQTIARPTATPAKALRDGARRKGAVLIYSISALTVMIGMATLAVDWGHVQLAKTQLQGAADAAARAGASALAQSPADAVAQAQWTASKNVVDGIPLSLTAADVEIGTWDTARLSFTKLLGVDQYRGNAVRVVANRTASRSSAIPLSFVGVFGAKDSANLTAEAVVMLVSAVNVDQPVAATANPFLSGMAAGSVASRNNPHGNADYAGTAKNPKQSAQTVNLPFAAGTVLTFDSIDGTAQHDPNLSKYEPDGQLDDIGHNNPTPNDSNSKAAGYYNENGIADVKAPINALVGVFLGDESPDLSAAPANLDFSTAASRDFQKLEPKLKQIFFIGDGVDASGKTQSFVAPKGATRLFLATWDFYEWNNNSGTRTVKVNRPEQVVTVK